MEVCKSADLVQKKKAINRAVKHKEAIDTLVDEYLRDELSALGLNTNTLVKIKMGQESHIGVFRGLTVGEKWGTIWFYPTTDGEIDPKTIGFRVYNQQELCWLSRLEIIDIVKELK